MTSPVTQSLVIEPKIDQNINPDVQTENQTHPDPLSTHCVTSPVTQSLVMEPKIDQNNSPEVQTKNQTHSTLTA